VHDRLSAWFPLALVSVLAALTFWLDRVAQPPSGPRDGAQRHDPDYIVDKLVVTRMDEKGLPKHTLYTEKMTHYPDDDSTRLVAPRFTSNAASRSPVTVTASRGLVSANGENIYFEDSVEVRRAPYGNSSELVIRTDFLHVIPDDHIAKTDRAVTITDANTTVSAVGLELNAETRVLKLLSQVRGTFHGAGQTK